MSNKEKNEGNFDLSGVFHIQKNYLTDNYILCEGEQEFFLISYIHLKDSL